MKLVSRTLEQRFIADVPQRLIGDKAYDSDKLDREVLHQFGTEMIARTAKAVGATGKLRMAAHCAASSAAGK